jgi:hypothetical protein
VSAGLCDVAKLGELEAEDWWWWGGKRPNIVMNGPGLPAVHVPLGGNTEREGQSTSLLAATPKGPLACPVSQ